MLTEDCAIMRVAATLMPYQIDEQKSIVKFKTDLEMILRPLLISEIVDSLFPLRAPY